MDTKVTKQDDGTFVITFLGERTSALGFDADGGSVEREVNRVAETVVTMWRSPWSRLRRAITAPFYRLRWRLRARPWGY